MNQWQSADEDKRNADYADLWKAMINEAYDDVAWMGCHHHMLFHREGHLLASIPAADTLIFDHSVARKIWGNEFKAVLARLAVEPVETRDALLGRLFLQRKRETP